MLIHLYLFSLPPGLPYIAPPFLSQILELRTFSMPALSVKRSQPLIRSPLQSDRSDRHKNHFSPISCPFCEYITATSLSQSTPSCTHKKPTPPPSLDSPAAAFSLPEPISTFAVSVPAGAASLLSPSPPFLSHLLMPLLAHKNDPGSRCRPCLTTTKARLLPCRSSSSSR